MKTRKQWIAMLLMLAMLFTALPIAAFAEDEPETPAVEGQEKSTPPEEENAGEAAMKPMQAPPADGIKVRLFWHETGQKKGRYNFKDEGHSVTLPFIIEATGKNEAGEQEEFEFLFNPATSTIGEQTTTTIGEELNGTIAGTTEKKGAITYLKELTVDGKTYTDVVLGNGALIIDANQRIYSVMLQDTGSTGKITAQVMQNMETKTEVKKPSLDQIILDSDKPYMKVRYSVQNKHYDDPWKEVLDRNGQVYQVEHPFSVETIYLCTKTKGVAATFHEAVEANKLMQFSPYNGKIDTYKLHADWTGERKDDLKKRYDLEVDGNDLEGWTVTLTSKIKPEVLDPKEEEIDFETKYENDPTMYVGEETVKQEGVKGRKTVTITKYYIMENNDKVYLEETKTTEKITKPPVDKIILRGTKEKPVTPSEPSEIVKVVFNANEGAWANGETRRVYRRAVGSTITIESAPMREGYKFLYWEGSKYYPGDRYLVEGGHVFTAMWEKDEQKPEEKPSVDSKIKTPRGSALTLEEIAKILAGSKTVIPAIPRAGVGR